MKTLPPKELIRTRNILDTKIDVFFKKQILELKKNEPALVPTYEMLHEFCRRGGKRLRAYLVLVGFKMAGQKPRNAIYDVALGIELLHTSLLIHDDIIDNDAFRRGRPTIHEALKKKFRSKQHVEDLTVFMGDILSSLALEPIFRSAFSDDKKVLAAKTMGVGAVATAVGEIMDIRYSHKNVTEELVEKILLLKTARYSVSQPLMLGYLLGGGTKHLSIIQKMGDSFGTAFQIRDDALGVVGKKAYQSRGGDIREGKPFALAPHMSKLLTKKEKMFLSKLFSKKVVQDKEIFGAKQLLASKFIPDKALEKAEKYIQMAKKNAGAFLGGPLKKEVLDIIDYVVMREE